MTVLNQTSISYSKISAGLVQAECFINTTKSKNSLTVSSFKSLTQRITLEGGVSKATIGQNVTQQCTQVTVPNVQQYVLNFLKDNTVIAQWKVDGKKKTFSVPNKVDGLQVSQGNASSATTFSSVSLLPTSAKANGTYQCQFVFGSSSNGYKSISNFWHGNFAPPAPPTTTTKMPSTIVPTTPTKKPMTTTTKKPMTTTTKMPMTTTTKKPMTTTKKPMTTTKMPMTTPTRTTMKPTTKMMSTTTKTPPPMTTETPKQTTTTSKSEPTKPETTTTSHHHHHSTTPKHHHPTTTSKPKGAATSIQASFLASFFALFVFLFAH